MANLPNPWRNSPAEGSRTWGNDSFRALTNLQREMDRMFDDFFNGGQRSEMLNDSDVSAIPLCDTQETDSHYLISFDMPGLSKDDVKIEIQDNFLHVRGEKKAESRTEEKGKKNLRSERSYQTYDRWISLPAQVKGAGVEAHMAHGVLQIALPKAENTAAKQIPIGEGKTGFFAKLLDKKDEKKGQAA